MYEKCPASLKMTRQILQNGFFDDNAYDCQIITYKPEEERIYLLAKDQELTLFSLDGLYDCLIETEGTELKCNGVIRERYYNKTGKIIVFSVQNGFYKNSVNLE